MPEPGWKLVTSSTVSAYHCGLRAGDRVTLRRDLVIRDDRGPTGTVFPAGEVWLVLKGAEDDPGVIWFRQADGRRHTWSDGPEVFEMFEIASRGEA